MQIKPIKTEQDYKEALRSVEPMFDSQLVAVRTVILST